MVPPTKNKDTKTTQMAGQYSTGGDNTTQTRTDPHADSARWRWGRSRVQR
jgi:hypothetical protein